MAEPTAPRTERVPYTVDKAGMVGLLAPDGKAVSLPEPEAVARIREGWNPADAAGGGEAFGRAVASAGTFGLSEGMLADDAAFKLARTFADAKRAQAQIAFDTAKATGDLAQQMAAQQQLEDARTSSSRLEEYSSQRLAYDRARTAAMVADHPVEHIAGNIVGTLLPTGPVNAVGKLAGGLVKGTGALAKLGSLGARLSAEGVAMGVQSGVEEGAATGEYSASRIATKALEGAAVNAAFGLGGLGLSKVVGKAWKGGASKLFGAGDSATAEAAERISVAKAQDAALSKIAEADPAIGKQVAEVRAAYDAGMYSKLAEDSGLTAASRVERIPQGSVAAEVAARAQRAEAMGKLATVREQLGKAGFDASPLDVWGGLDSARTAFADAQAKVQENAASWFKGNLQKAAAWGGGLMGLAGHAAEDPVAAAFSAIKHAVVGTVLAKVSGGLAAGTVGKMMAGGAEAAAKVGTLAEKAAAQAAPYVARAATPVALSLLTPDEFDAASKHVQAAAEAAPQIAKATNDALFRAGLEPDMAQSLADRRTSAIMLLASKAQAGDRVGFSRALQALANPGNWSREAKSPQGLSRETWQVMRSQSPASAASLSAAAQQLASDAKSMRKLTPSHRRMVQMMAGAEQSIGTIQQHAFAPETPPQTVAGRLSQKAAPPPSASEGLEERFGAGKR